MLSENHLETSHGTQSTTSDTSRSPALSAQSSSSSSSNSIQDVIVGIAAQEVEEEEQETHEELECRATGDPLASIKDVDDELMFRVKRAGDQLVSNAASLIENRTSNLVESFMSLRTKMDGGKTFNRVQSGSFQHRCAATGLRVRLGPKWGAASWEKVTGLEAGSVLTQTAKIAERQYLSDVNRKRSHSYRESRAAAKFRKSNDGSKKSFTKLRGECPAA